MAGDGFLAETSEVVGGLIFAPGTGFGFTAYHKLLAEGLAGVAARATGDLYPAVFGDDCDGANSVCHDLAVIAVHFG